MKAFGKRGEDSRRTFKKIGNFVLENEKSDPEFLDVLFLARPWAR